MIHKFKYSLIVVFIALTHNLGAQTPTINYILERTMLEPTTDESQVFEKAGLQNMSYFDGLGRPIQQISMGASPTGNDIIQIIEYDKFGREAKKYMPYTHDVSGAYRANGLSEQKDFYNPIFPNDSLFAETRFDNSPLNRVLEQGNVGNDWQIGQNTLKYDYGTNDGSIIIWEVNDDLSGNMTVAANGTYDAGTLYVNTLTDEENHATKEYKNMQGQVILTEAPNNHKTWYVYDDFGLLRCVIPPLAESTINPELCYYYKYDERKRMTEKKIPGADWIYMVYNTRNLLVLTQDGNMRKNKQWMLTGYDSFNRPEITGIYTHNQILNQKEMRDVYDVSFSDSSDFQAYSITHYDTYSAQILANYECTDYNTKVKGLITYTETYIPTTGQWLNTVNYYDDKYRVIKTFSDNHLGGTDIISNQYDFVGKILETKQEHTIDSTTTTIVKHFMYDHTGRLLEIKMKLNANNTIIIAKNEYNELGQLQNKSTHNVSGSNYLYNTNYTYNIRGWMTKMDNTDMNNKNLFNINLMYNKNTVNTSNNIYNGNISAMQWSSARLDSTKTYDFTYDALNRLTNANFAGTTTENYNTDYNYDKNGNILNLNRYGQFADNTFGQIDQLDYAYRGNQLIKVNDEATDAAAQFAGFTDNGMQNPVIVDDSTTHEYLYDPNGNLTADYNKQINHITYNHLNLPILIDLANDNIIEYIYDAAGIKLQQKVYKNGNLQKTTDYIANFVYENSSLKFIIIDDGRLLPNEDTTAYKYEYFITDHLGNTRVSVKDSLGYAVVEQEDHYYPFGMRMKGQSYTNPLQAAANKYLYNGKELQDNLGLDWYDYGARFYDAQIGRFHTQDKFAEKYVFMSPYQYAANNPINLIDVNGDSLSPTAQIWANKIISVSKDKIKTYNEKKEKASEKKKGKWQKKIDGYKSTLTEIQKLKDSDEMYNVVENSNLGGAGKSGGKTVFNFGTNSVDIHLTKDATKADAAHEFKHAFQFETSELDLTSKGGGLANDKEDEYQGYDRGGLFGTSIYGRKNLPPHQKILRDGSISVAPTSKSMNNVYKRQEFKSKVAYRINKKTHIYDPSK